jgi:hypothetical protein
VRLALRSFRFAGFAVLCLVATACGADGRFVMVGSARAPSTSGIVEIDDIDGGNTLVTLHLEYLHPPDRLEQGTTTYVVWFEAKGRKQAPILAGPLRYDESARTGDFSGTSPMQHFVVKVTAERERAPGKPSAYVIAAQEVAID